jgi:hypothetical protein
MVAQQPNQRQRKLDERVLYRPVKYQVKISNISQSESELSGGVLFIAV